MGISKRKKYPWEEDEDEEEEFENPADMERIKSTRS